MENEKITIVVPVYNTERYLNQCIQSIVRQSYKNLEILLIDDGSADQSLSICEKWEKSDDRIRVISTGHGGPGTARSEGIKRASGKYIYFLDSDDYVDAAAIGQMHKYAKKENAQIVIAGGYQIDQNGAVKKSFLPSIHCDKYKDAGEMFLQSFLVPEVKKRKQAEIGVILMSGILYDMELFKNEDLKVIYPQNAASEDICFLMRMCKNAECIITIPVYAYYYRMNPTSITHMFTYDMNEKNKRFYKEAEKICGELGYGEETYRDLAYPYTSNVIGILKAIMALKLPKTKKTELIRRMISDAFSRKIFIRAIGLGGTVCRNILIFSMIKGWARICYYLIMIKNNLPSGMVHKG